MAVDLAELGLVVRSDGVVVADKRLSDLEQQAKKTETATERLVRQTEKLSKQLDKAGKSMRNRITLPLLVASGAAVRFAGNFESSFANIRKTVDATEPEFAKMSAEIRQMAKEIPTAVEELNNLGGVAGQLGVESRNIVAFTRTIAMLGDTTDIAGEQAALSLSRFMNVMGTAQDQIDRVGSTIVGLGNQFAAMESEIVTTATSLAAFGNQMGLTEAQVLAYATAIAASGGQTEAASTAFQKTASTMQQAVIEMNEDLFTFARIAKVSSQEFAEAFRGDASNAILLFLKGLRDISDQGKSTASVLDDLGLADQRLQREFGKLLGNLDQLEEAIGVANVEWEANTALTEEARKRYETFNSEMLILWNNIKDFGITIGNDLIPVVRGFSESLQNIISDLQTMTPEARQNLIVWGAFAAALGPVLIALGLLLDSIVKIRGALLLLGGPGAIVGVVAVALGTLVLRQKEAADAAFEHAEGITAVVDKMTTLSMLELARAIQSKRDHIVALQEEVEGYEKLARAVGETHPTYKKAQDSIRKLNLEIDAEEDSIQKLAAQMQRLRDGWEQNTEATEDSTEAAENFLALIKQISTVELPKVTLGTSTLLPKIATESEKLIDALEREKEALEGGEEAWTEYERAMFQAQAVADLGEKATVDQIERVRELAGAIFDLGRASEESASNSERAFKRFFVELSDNGENAFENLARSFEQSFVEKAVDNMLDSFESAFPKIAKSFDGMLGTVIGGISLAVDLIGSLLGGGTPSSNAGLLMGARENFSGVDPERLFGSFDLFGNEAQLFARRQDQDAAIAASRQFIALEETIGRSLENIGLDLDQFSINLRGLDENAQGVGAFLGQAAEDGEAMGQSIAMQLLSVARQSIEQIAAQSDGLIPPDVLEDILFPRGAATTVGDVTTALNDFFSTLSEAEQERLRNAQAIEVELLRMEEERQRHLEGAFESAVDRTIDFLESVTDPINDLTRTIRNDIAAITGEFTRAMDSAIDSQIRRLDDLRRAALANHADEIRREQELHNTRIRLADSLAQFAQNLRTGNLSPLSNRGRFEAAQEMFRSTLAAAMGGDVAAAERLQNAAQSYADLSRDMFASSMKHVDNMDEILSGLDAAAELLGASEFNPQEANDRLVAELQQINAQLSVLPTGISSKLAPLFDQILISGLAAGQSMRQIATRIESIIATIPAGVVGSTPPSNPVAQYAFTEQDARNAVNQVIATANSTFDIVSRSAAILKDMGFSAAFLQQLFPGTDIFGLLDTYGIPHFEKGGAVMQDGPAMLHRNEHVVNADRDNLVVNVQSNTEGITELREIMKEIRDNDKRYQEEEIKLTKENQRTLSNLTEAVRKSA